MILLPSCLYVPQIVHVALCWAVALYIQLGLLCVPYCLFVELVNVDRLVLRFVLCACRLSVG